MGIAVFECPADSVDKDSRIFLQNPCLALFTWQGRILVEYLLGVEEREFVRKVWMLVGL